MTLPKRLLHKSPKIASSLGIFGTLMCFNHSLSKNVFNNFKVIDRFYFCHVRQVFQLIGLYVPFEFMTKNFKLNKMYMYVDQKHFKINCLN